MNSVISKIKIGNVYNRLREVFSWAMLEFEDSTHKRNNCASHLVHMAIGNRIQKRKKKTMVLRT
jgi:hypothetical protein